MTHEQITQAASTYAAKKRTTRSEHAAFVAGAESRQAEIDELVEALKEASAWIVSQDEFNSAVQVVKKHTLNPIQLWPKQEKRK